MQRAAWIGLIAVAAVAGLAVGRKSGDASGGTRFDVPLRASGGRSALKVDLHAPAGNPTSTLVVFLQGNDPGEPDERPDFAAEVADAFLRKEAAVAAIDFRISQEISPREGAAAAANAIAELGANYARVVLIGRGIGAWAAVTLALDGRLFQEAGFDQTKVKGVVAMRGPYELTGDDMDPAAFAKKDAPPVILLSGGSDGDNWPRVDRTFAKRLTKAGVHVERYIVPYRDQRALTHWSGADNDVGDLVTSFAFNGPAKLEPDSGALEMEQRWWSNAPLDDAEFRADAAKVKSGPVDAELKKTLDILFKIYPYMLWQMPGKSFDYVDLSAWLASRPESEVGKGDWLVVTNLRGEQLYYPRKLIEELKPVLVVGLDDETNLYRLFGYYRLRHAYSWKKGEEPMPLMIRPLGAFLHFPTPPPADLANRTYAPFGLTSKSFHWQADDPLKNARTLSASILPTVIGSEGCLKCHSFRGEGAKAHHMLSSNGQTYGAFALSLEEYPKQVLQNFLFDQPTVAKGFDVTPLMVDRPIAQEIFDAVNASPKP
jgi:dienelactone hydrolase